MSEILITTESGTDLTAEHAKRLGVFVIPMYVVFDRETKADGHFPVTEVMEYYQRTKSIPTTSAVNPQEYITFFKSLREEHPEADIVHIAYTSLASSTYQNARIALDELEDEKIFLVDSLNVSGGISLICEKAAELLKTAESGAELTRLLETWIRRARVSFLPNTLEYLKAGGRVSNAAYLGATLLSLKPLIVIKDGKLVASKKYRGRMEQVAFKYLEEFVQENHLDRSVLYLFSAEGFSPDLMEKLRERAKEMGFSQVFETKCGCVITCHGGPGALGIAGFETEA